MKIVLLLPAGALALLFLASFGPERQPASIRDQATHRMPCVASAAPDWGFFAHRRINRLAVLTLPPEMMVFFKPNIDWVADHATDPDMRRYATPWEGPRHYIDLDEYGAPPFDRLPRRFLPALQQHTEIFAVLENGDTLLVYGGGSPLAENPDLPWERFFSQHILPKFSSGDGSLNADSLQAFLKTGDRELPAVLSVFFQENLSKHGILPWHLQRIQGWLTNAFRQRDSKRILRYCADIGHYVGDAHVPLHTTSNYNGQKTGQVGIHGFWESRIPELFADEEYDYFVGKPNYLPQTADYFWDAVLASHSMVDSVLGIERALRLSFPEDRQMCPDMRNGRVIIAPCRDFAAAYQEAMQGMVERRLRAAIQAVASVWYTAWVDAGQPDLSKLDLPPTTEEELREEEAIRQKFNAGKILGRPEGE